MKRTPHSCGLEDRQRSGQEDQLPERDPAVSEDRQKSGQEDRLSDRDPTVRRTGRRAAREGRLSLRTIVDYKRSQEDVRTGPTVAFLRSAESLRTPN